jgi:hypothetical protein
MRRLLCALAAVKIVVSCGGESASETDETTAVETDETRAAETTLPPDRGPLFVVELSGDAEVPGPGAPEASGRLELEISAELATICINGEVDGTDEITGLHLHSGTADEPSEGGDLTIDLGSQPGEDDPLAPFPLNYCVDADPVELEDLLLELDEDPGDYFVHVITEEFPEGAARGQLTAA